MLVVNFDEQNDVTHFPRFGGGGGGGGGKRGRSGHDPLQCVFYIYWRAQGLTYHS